MIFINRHVNIKALPNTPYDGIIFHLVMHFDERYPSVPPKVELLTHLKYVNFFWFNDRHGHVFGNEQKMWICLDMLETSHHEVCPCEIQLILIERKISRMDICIYSSEYSCTITIVFNGGRCKLWFVE